MKANKCCCCGKGLRYDEVIYADANGIPTVRGKPWCPDCLSDHSKSEEDLDSEFESNGK